MAGPLDDSARQQALVTFLTTEHFTLQGARTSAVAETSSRLQVYASVLSSSIVALALVAEVSRLGRVFFVFALALLPIVYVLGLATIGRLVQSWDDWFLASQGMSRIRRYFVDVAPEAAPYLIMPTSDDPWVTLRGAGVSERRWWSRLVTAVAVVAIVNSAVAGFVATLVGILLTDHQAFVPGVLGALAFLLSLGLLIVGGYRRFQRRVASAEVRFAVDVGAPQTPPDI